MIFALCSNQMMLFEMQHLRVSYSPFDTRTIQEFCFRNWPKPKSTALQLLRGAGLLNKSFRISNISKTSKIGYPVTSIATAAILEK